ncbi:MAG: group intron reverse transcriptase/maturase [Firmicutes bacterium]|nr:group intron reverse transcriptase/maturase [Bacillota bacterium]
MTTNKAKKKAKIRNAEYYDCQDILDKLYDDSRHGKKFKHLMELITTPENIKLA